MNSNLPVNRDNQSMENGSISFAPEVVAIIAGIAASEIEGVAGMTGPASIAEILGRKQLTRGVKVDVGLEEASVDLYIIIDFGALIPQVGEQIQENVRKAIETMTGLRVVEVNVHVQGISFEKEKRQLDTMRRLNESIDSDILVSDLQHDEHDEAEIENDTADSSTQETTDEDNLEGAY